MNRPVAIFGDGVSGHAAARLAERVGSQTVVYDRKGEEFTAAEAPLHRLVVYSPGFDSHHPWLELARKAGCVCLSEIDFAALFWAGRVVAVTGTNGKTTLTEFLAHALCSVGQKAHAAGNIGRAFSELARERDGGTGEVAIVEVSSFQAEQIGHMRAGGLLWTNFAEDHLERHRSLRAYFYAKWELVKRAPPERVFAGSSVQRYAVEFGADLPRAAAVQTEGLPPDPALSGTAFERYPQRENFALAAAWWRSEGLDLRALCAAARTFRLGRHRISRVRTVDGVTFWNDSKGTNFHAVEAALAGFGSPVVLIAGGRSKGGDIAGFARRISPRLAHAILIGETADILAVEFSALGIAHTRCHSLADAVQAAAGVSGPGTHVLLSPGFASFDMFRSYEDRGDQFERAVHDLRAVRV